MSTQNLLPTDWTLNNHALSFLMPFQAKERSLITHLKRGDINIFVYQDSGSEEFLVTYAPPMDANAGENATDVYYYCDTYEEVLEFLDQEFSNEDRHLTHFALSA